MNNYITMQYPFDGSGANRLFDGGVHQIKPTRFRRLVLNGIEYFIMDYHDLTAGIDATTLIARVGNLVIKVPVDDYTVLFDFIRRANLPFCNYNPLEGVSNIVLGNFINAADFVSVAEKEYGVTKFQLFRPSQAVAAQAAGGSPQNPSDYKFANLDEPPHTYHYHHHYATKEDDIRHFSVTKYVTVDNEFNSMGGVFSSSGCRLGHFNDETYTFIKDPSYPNIDREIARGLSLMPSFATQFTYKFNIKINNVTMGFVEAGNGQAYLVAMLPGVYEYTVNYARCKEHDDYVASEGADTIVIDAKLDKYRDRHDTARVWHDGCQKELRTRFYDLKGNTIIPGARNK